MRIDRHPNPRKQGDAGLGAAIGWFACNGYSVCVPLTDSQRYDLVVEDATGLKRVQVKTTTRILASSHYEVTLRTKGGNQSGAGRVSFFDPLDADLLFVATGDGTLYLIPTGELKSRATITLGRLYDRYRVNTPL